MRRGPMGVRLCDVGGCHLAWPCKRHGTLQRTSATSMLQLARAHLNDDKCPGGCGFSVCSKTGPCAPKTIGCAECWPSLRGWPKAYRARAHLPTCSKAPKPVDVLPEGWTAGLSDSFQHESGASVVKSSTFGDWYWIGPDGKIDPGSQKPTRELAMDAALEAAKGMEPPARIEFEPVAIEPQSNGDVVEYYRPVLASGTCVWCKAPGAPIAQGSGSFICSDYAECYAREARLKTQKPAEPTHDACCSEFAGPMRDCPLHAPLPAEPELRPGWELHPGFTIELYRRNGTPDVYEVAAGWRLWTSPAEFEDHPTREAAMIRAEYLAQLEPVP